MHVPVLLFCDNAVFGNRQWQCGAVDKDVAATKVAFLHK